jgi:hypothetical protein
MRDQYIFDIPVYRLTSDEFDAEIELHLAKRVKWLRSYDSQRRPLSPERRDQQLHSIIADSGGPWQFNQIIGWLRLFAEGRTIGCHMWWVDAKRINRRMRRKRLYLSTFSDVLGAWFPKESSSEIFATLLQRLSEMVGERPYANRYIDLDVFRRLGPFVDWRGILDQPASKKIDSNRRTK